MFKASDYLLTPKDVIGYARSGVSSLRRRHIFGVVLAIVTGVIARTLFAQSLELSYFISFAVVLLGLRKSSRVSFTAALICLLLAPMFLALSGADILIVGDAWADAVAVWAYYFLIIGTLQYVVSHIRDALIQRKLRRMPVTDIQKPS